MRRLNNKGFTLIELLAVIVILAIVMGVAANAVLNVMNDSRRNTLKSSAKSAADAFRSAYAEMQLKNEEEILGIADLVVATGEATKPIQVAADKLNLTSSNYDLEKSFVTYNATAGSFTVCLVSSDNGSYHLESAESKRAWTVASGTLPKETMWACSNDEESWSGDPATAE